MTSDEVRKDVFSVKLFYKHNGIWSHEKMFYSRKGASAWVREAMASDSFAMTKIVHPKQWVVEVYVALGNDILD